MRLAWIEGADGFFGMRRTRSAKAQIGGEVCAIIRHAPEPLSRPADDARQHEAARRPVAVGRLQALPP